MAEVKPAKLPPMVLHFRGCPAGPSSDEKGACTCDSHRRPTTEKPITTERVIGATYEDFDAWYREDLIDELIRLHAAAAALKTEQQEIVKGALADAELLADLVNIGPRKPSENLAEDASEGYRAAIRELLLPVAQRLVVALRLFSASPHPSRGIQTGE